MLDDHLNQSCVIDYYSNSNEFNDYIKVATVNAKCRKEEGERILQRTTGEYYTTSRKFFVGMLSTHPRAWQDKIDGLLIASVSFMTNGEGITVGYTILA